MIKFKFPTDFTDFHIGDYEYFYGLKSLLKGRPSIYLTVQKNRRFFLLCSKISARHENPNLM